MSVIETERLVLRRFTPEDAADNYRINTDAENMRFMGRQPDSVEFERYHIRRHIANYYDRHGFGLWAAVLKENNQLIGRCGLLYQQIEDTQEVEVTYLIDRHYWGRGLATEAAREAVKLGFEKYKFPRIIAVINPENVASVRVAEKIGMEYERDVMFKDFGEVAMYALKARDSVAAIE
ncbi:MAG TPA: GNAT family N-acetyltransferase [Pyrinomonadaceae bacterium]|jgi:ribosomal-protein-alanine N-acetyltransferase|nr:GNAT family N-acetyltransferase [Pyrinomonadaceae bacterium]